MKFSRDSQKPWITALLVAMLMAGLGELLLNTALGRGLINLSYDFLTVTRGNLPAEEAVIVYMDDASYDRLNQPLDAPWNRDLHAQLIDRLTRAGAKAITFDVVFSDPSVTRPEADTALAESMSRHGGVVLGVDNVYDGPNAKRLVPPFDLLLDQAAAVGSVEMVPSRDLIVRRHTPLDEVIPTLSWATMLVASEGERTLENPEEERWINYYGPPNYLTWISYYEALDPDLVKDELFKDRIVFVGDRRLTKFAGERKDEYRNPFSFWMSDVMKEELGSLFISGVEIQATAFLNYWRGDWLRRLSPATEQWLVILLGIVFGWFMVRSRPIVALGMASVILVALMATAYSVHVVRLIWIPWLIPTVQLFLALAIGIAFNSVRLYVQKRMYEYTLGLYLSPKLVKRFSRDANLLKPGGEEQTLTIMFTDIANFTDHTQQMDSDTLAQVMNQYFHVAVTECIHPTDGTVVKYIGDAVFAFWNAPEAQKDHALRTCRAALMLQSRQFAWPNGVPLITRIGVHTGLARVGNFGSPERVDYTALGENVNMASRLEGLNKYLKTQCLISRATYDEIEGELVTRRMGAFQLKGFDSSVEVFELLSESGASEQTEEFLEVFAQALLNYERGETELAVMGFEEVLRLRPEDGPSQFFLDRIKQMQAEPLPEGWDGRTQLWEK